jgi:hypothetical protein
METERLLADDALTKDFEAWKIKRRPYTKPKEVAMRALSPDDIS